VESTEAGLALRGQVEKLWTDLETATTGDMPQDERETLLRCLGKLERNLVAVQAAHAAGSASRSSGPGTAPGP
jgi:hypothetical protein